MNKTRFTDYQAYQQWHDATWDHRRDMSERGRYKHLLLDTELTIERVLDHGAIVSDGSKSEYVPFNLLQGEFTHVQRGDDWGDTVYGDLPHTGFYLDVDGQFAHVLGDPNAPEETMEALREMVRAATKAIQEGKIGKKKP